MCVVLDEVVRLSIPNSNSAVTSHLGQHWLKSTVCSGDLGARRIARVRFKLPLHIGIGHLGSHLFDKVIVLRPSAGCDRSWFRYSRLEASRLNLDVAFVHLYVRALDC